MELSATIPGTTKTQRLFVECWDIMGKESKNHFLNIRLLLKDMVYMSM